MPILTPNTNYTHMHNLLLVLLLAASTQLAATNYYLDATDGNDANDGLTPATAWQSLLNINANLLALVPGDSVLFKRGEAWYGTALGVPYSGTADEPITFSNYGDSGEPLPIISVVDTLAGSQVPTSWTMIASGVNGGNIFAFDLDQNPNRLFLDNEEVLRSVDSMSLGVVDEQGVINKWFWSDFDSTLYIHEIPNPALKYDSIAGSVQVFAGLTVLADHLLFDGVDFQGGSVAALSIVSGDSILIRNCRLGRNANAGVSVTGATFEGLGTVGSSNVEINYNFIESGYEIYHGLGIGRGCDDGVFLRFAATNCKVIDNVFTNWEGNAVELLGIVEQLPGVNNNLIEGNFITAPDVSISAPLRADGIAGKTQHNRFVRNIVNGVRAGCSLNGDNNVVEHNVFRNIRQSDAVLGNTAYAFVVSSSSFTGGFVSNKNTYDHNLVVDTDEAAFLILGNTSINRPQGHLIRNNIFSMTGLAPFAGYLPGPGLYIEENQVAEMSYQNNLFYSINPASPNVWLLGVGGLSAAQFNTRNGEGGHSVSANLSGDPLFADLADGNYSLQDLSPAIDAGLDLGYTLDLVRNERFQGVAPDIGPQESGLTLPTALGDFTAVVSGKANVTLNWDTQLESATDRFHIERKSPERNWAEVGQVAAAGLSRSALDYQFIDDHAPVGQLHYRLRMADLNGDYSYSPIRTVELTTDQISLRWLDRRTATVATPDGRELISGECSFTTIDGRLLPLTVHGNVLSFSQSLPSGVYLLTIGGEAVKVGLR